MTILGICSRKAGINRLRKLNAKISRTDKVKMIIWLRKLQAENSQTDQTKMIDWLQKLQAEISRVEVISMELISSKKSTLPQRRVLKRRLTLEEFEYFKEISPQFIVVPFRAEFGYNFGVYLYAHQNVMGTDPKLIFMISGKYLPEEMGKTLKDAWEVLSVLSHSDANRERLRLHRMSPPLSKEHFFKL